jgi:glycosyltransferase involved in cell wall biosynthesis
MPVYNRAGLLRRAVDSVLSQDFGDFEFVIVDDGSRDGSAEAVAAIGDPRIRLVRHIVNKGAAAARNSGIEAARGTYVAFIDSDDAWLPGKLRIQVGDLDARPDSCAATTTAFLYRRPGGVETLRRPEAPRGWPVELLDICSVSPGSTLMARRAVFRHIGGFDAGLGRLEDWDWLLRYLRGHDLAVLPEPLAVIHNASAPDPAIVAAAARTMAARHGPDIAGRLGHAAARRFRASLNIEIAFAHAMRRNPAGALRSIAAAALLSPPRVLKLARRIAQRLAERAAWA